MSAGISVGIQNKEPQKMYTFVNSSLTAPDKILSTPFLKKYIQQAKRLKPKLTDEVSQLIADEYVKLRETLGPTGDINAMRTQPITPRSIEALIRVSTAHAKLRMSEYVETIDAKIAISLIENAILATNLTGK